MKKFYILFISLLAIYSISSCRNSSKTCVESMIDEGYSYEEAEEACNDARDEYNSRR